MRTTRIALYEYWSERHFGVSTGLVIPVDRLDYADEAKLHAEPYFPSSYLFLREIFMAGPLDCRDQVFIDFGCGMGRVLLFASALPFRRVIGVELSHFLCTQARRNLELFYAREKRTAPDWSIVNCDVRAFAIPSDATVFYRYNPFDSLVVSAVVKNIETSLKKHPRQCYLVYANPRHDDLLQRPGFHKIFASTTDYAIYSIVG